MPPALEVRGASKTYRRWWSRRRIPALIDVGLTVEPGCIFGLLGPNGAGKTTLVKLALTIAHPDRGEIRILGEPVQNLSILRRVGYLPENPRFPAHLNAWHVLRLYGSLSGADPEKLKANAAYWLKRVGLEGWERVKVAKFSKGMVERLAFAQAVIHEPDLIFLDEPTDGLDPLGRKEVRAICRELASAGKTVFINSHILAEIEMVCDRIALMKDGRIIDQGTVRELTAGGGEYEVVVAANIDGVAAWFQSKNLPFTAVDSRFHVTVPDRRSVNALVDAMRQRDVEIEAIIPKRRTLESVFIERVC